MYSGYVYRFRNRLRIFILISLALITVACAHRPPTGALPGRINVISAMNTAFQDTWINHYVPRGINDYAGYEIANKSTNAPYKISVTIVAMSNNVIGYKQTYNGVMAVYRTRIEYTFTFSGPSGDAILRRNGWAEHNSEQNAIYRMAKDIGAALYQAGLLKSSYYIHSEK